jgi:hypothetical protein
MTIRLAGCRPPVDARLPITSHLLRPAWLQATETFHRHTDTYTRIPTLSTPTFFYLYEYLPLEANIPHHSTQSILATLMDNGPFEMTTMMPSRQTMSCVRWGCIAWEWDYDYACMGLDLKDIPARDQHWEFWDSCRLKFLLTDFAFQLVYCYAL